MYNINSSCIYIYIYIYIYRERERERDIHIVSCRITSSAPMSCHILPHLMQWHASIRSQLMSCHAMPRHVRPRHVTSGHATPRQEVLHRITVWCVVGN